ncbi:hypothetical protein SAMN02745751_00740 [Dethiosulfatibacter aminovorans DSM 17477]|uniref:Lipoprotein n=1 Tax=Dethiosulfatibacter aminovorans DSM 17477 TaxID=1121476 RepID=A0A1M6D0Z4_9FIRM|nr:hypothetical protein [Dethiosulfatibacter aminovorans]SHI66734.1 hypothetical protein SAMN02745751_00740 [Dethiosulfatibacter aminovorans DSM 17477]
MKKNILAILLLCIVMLCGCTDDVKNEHDTETVNEILNYVNINIKDFQNIESRIIKRYNDMEYDIDNENEIIDALKNEILPEYKEHFENLSNVAIKNDEIKEIHSIYLQSAKYQLEAFELYLSYIENKNYSDLKSVNSKINSSNEYFKLFKKSLVEFADKHEIPYN